MKPQAQQTASSERFRRVSRERKADDRSPVVPPHLPRAGLFMAAPETFIRTEAKFNAFVRRSWVPL